MTGTEVLARSIRSRRKDLGLTQEEVADLAGCSVRFVGFLEAAKPSVQLDKVVAVLGVLGLELAVRTRTT